MKIKIDCLSRLRGNVMVNHVWLPSTKARIVEKYLVISTNPSIHRVYYSWSADPWHPCHIGTSEGFMKICFIKIMFLGAKGNGYLRSKTEYMFCHHFVTCRRKPTSASPRNFSDKKSRGSFFFYHMRSVCCPIFVIMSTQTLPFIKWSWVGYIYGIILLDKKGNSLLIWSFLIFA